MLWIISRISVDLVLIVAILVDLGGLLRGDLSCSHRITNVVGVLYLVRLVLVVLFVIRDIVVNIFVSF
jgi:hypothetical protein